MKRIPTRMLVATTFTLASALAIAQASAPQPSQTAPAQTPATTPAQVPAQAAPPPPTTAQPAQPLQTTPTQMQTAPPPPQPGPGPAAPLPPGNAKPDPLSAPSLKAAPAPQGCSPKGDKGDKDRVRLRDSCGVLLDASGKPVPNISLELVESGQQNAYLFVFSQTITDVNGRFDFGPVPSGHYLLRTREDAPITVYNFVATGTQNASGKCEKPVEVKAAPAGSCNSEIHGTKGSFPVLGSMLHRKGEAKGESKGSQQNQPPKQ